MAISLSAGATLHPLVLPARADAADAGILRAYAAARNASIVETTGRDDDCFEPGSLLPLLRSTPNAEKRQWYIEHEGEIVGCCAVSVPADDGGQLAFVNIVLARRLWSRGIGTAAHREVESWLREAGVRKIVHMAEHHAEEDSEMLASPTGFGEVPLDHSARFLRKHGYGLEQVARVSVLTWDDRTPAMLKALQQDAVSHATGYRVVQWELPTPEELRPGYAQMKSRMSTDVPDADLGLPEETWDAERIARHDDQYAQMGQTVLVTAAEHIATGELCAYNELVIGADPTSVTHQQDTLVSAEHRGRRLGMLVKTAGLQSWRERHPASPRVITYNAEENRPMLSINEAMGFTPIAYEGAWKKALS